MSFENYYLSNLFRETGENITNLEQCSAARNSLARLHNEGMKSLSNSSTCIILNQRLEGYFQMCNNASKESAMEDRLSLVNNLLKGKVQTRHCSNWKSKIRACKVQHKETFLKSLEKTGHCNMENAGPCKADNINEEYLKELFKKKVYKPCVSQNKPIVNEVNNVPKMQSNSVFKPKISPIVNSFNNVFEQKENTANEQKHHSTGDRFSDVYTNDNTFHKNSHDKSITSFDSNSGIKNSFNSPFESNQNKSTSRCQQSNETNQVNINTFRTARSELNIQNKKKYGNNKQNYQNVPEPNVIVKRSLGTTRSSVQNKFVPPLASSESPQAQASEPLDESEEDERLKHIDPKMIEFIRSEIIDSSAPVGWDDIAGLEFAKSAIQEAVVWPLLRPDIFTGLRRPPKGILLFGPPGTGKTLIGKCIASQCCATFFSISASSLTSKWIGDGEKMVRALFAVARCHQPAVVFIDEIDSLLTQRSDSEHEATRRIKTEFLVQLDGAATGDEDRFLVIGATNRPQELDEAARRRLVKRLYIPLPDTNARQQIIQRLMSTERNSLSEHDVIKISQLTDGYSGADMRSLCSEAALGPIRAVPLSQITNIQCDQVRPVNAQDFERALTRVRPSVSGNDLEHYIIWDKTYGSGSV